ncbi:hypothetical protein QR680_015904 [Steinernema hermaphroditum]|uniref:lysozyme n=1 Tax=Steinernema hermaphroditum TaxID=289476 RepID=A0AA39HBI6_9BILA|nr:hypothetical protein QR680_015904 [Steinernema hermaphroditum]
MSRCWLQPGQRLRQLRLLPDQAPVLHRLWNPWQATRRIQRNSWRRCTNDYNCATQYVNAFIKHYSGKCPGKRRCEKDTDRRSSTAVDVIEFFETSHNNPMLIA